MLIICPLYQCYAVPADSNVRCLSGDIEYSALAVNFLHGMLQGGAVRLCQLTVRPSHSSHTPAGLQPTGAAEHGAARDDAPGMQQAWPRGSLPVTLPASLGAAAAVPQRCC
jgi:hypothetical protein